MQRESTHFYAVPRAFSTSEVATAMGVTRQTVNRWVAAGRITAFDIGTPGRPRLRFTQAALDAFVKAGDLSPEKSTGAA